MSGNDVRPEQAAQLLGESRKLEQQVEQRTDQQTYGLIQVWGAVVVSLYIGSFLTTQGSPGMTNLLLLPILLFSLLIQGAHNRLRIHLRPTGWHLWLIIGATIVPFLVLATLNLSSVAYPWWLNQAAAGLVLLVVGGNGVRYLHRSETVPGKRWANEPLSPTARKVTVIVGTYLGIAAGTSAQAWFPIVSVILTMLILVALIGWRSPWGLPRVGSEWGPIHWAAFGLSITLIFVLAILLARTNWMTLPLSLVASAFVALPPIVAAFVPSGHGRN